MEQLPERYLPAPHYVVAQDLMIEVFKLVAMGKSFLDTHRVVEMWSMIRTDSSVAMKELLERLLLDQIHVVEQEPMTSEDIYAVLVKYLESLRLERVLVVVESLTT